MKTATIRVMLAIASALTLAGSAIAADPDLTGTWTLGVEGDHVIPMAMVIKQDGSRISGTIAMPTNQHGDRRDIPFEGEVSASGITFATKEGKPTLEFNGSLNEDGTLAGSVIMSADGPHHKMNWTAERLKERKKG